MFGDYLLPQPPPPSVMTGGLALAGFPSFLTFPVLAFPSFLRRFGPFDVLPNPVQKMFGIYLSVTASISIDLASSDGLSAPSGSRDLPLARAGVRFAAAPLSDLVPFGSPPFGRTILLITGVWALFLLGAILAGSPPGGCDSLSTVSAPRRPQVLPYAFGTCQPVPQSVGHDMLWQFALGHASLSHRQPPLLRSSIRSGGHI